MANTWGQGWGQTSQGWGQTWLKQVQETTQQLARHAGEGVEQARRRIEENQPQVEHFMKQLGDNVQKSVQNIQKGLAGPAEGVPPSADELSRLDFVYVTDRLAAMAFPLDRNARDGAGGNGALRALQGNDLDVVATLLKHRHRGKYMIWNISEEKYDYSKFEDQVLEFRFPGYPAPPLGLLFKMCASIENWLDADPDNVAVVHCLTGKGRTATVAACFLAWVGEFSTPVEALQYVAERKRVEMERLTIPSQRRYIQYFSNMLEGVRPRSEPLLLRRVIMNTIPTFGTTDGTLLRSDLPPPPPGADNTAPVGCCPYIQIFKGGKLIFTTTYQPPTSPRGKHAATKPPLAIEGADVAEASATAPADATTASADPATAVASGSSAIDGGTSSSAADTNGAAGGGAEGEGIEKRLPWAYPSDESIQFGVDCVVQGDLLIRCRHLSPGGARVSMFRAAFHTGYVPCGVLRLNKAQLDGACSDARFHRDFFLDLIFAPVESPDVAAASAAAAAAAPAAARDGTAAAAPAEAAAAAPAGDAEAAVKRDSVGGRSSGDAVMAAAAAAAESETVARREGGVVVDADAAGAYDSMLHRDARFWDDMSERKQRRQRREEARAAAAAAATPEQLAAAGAMGAMAPAKERALRKQFSIFGGDGGGDDDEAAKAAQRGGVSDAGTGAGRGTGGGAAAGGRGDAAGVAGAAAVAQPTKPKMLISNDDLLAQLAAAEAEHDDYGGGVGFGGGGGGGGGSGAESPIRVGPVSAAPVPAPAAATGVATGSAADSAGSSGPEARPAAAAAASATSPARAAAPPAEQPVAGAARELTALEELEKELGIEDLTGSRSGGSGGGGGIADVADFDLDTDLDDLEGYLESLTAGSKSGGS